MTCAASGARGSSAGSSAPTSTCSHPKECAWRCSTRSSTTDCSGLCSQPTCRRRRLSYGVLFVSLITPSTTTWRRRASRRQRENLTGTRDFQPPRSPSLHCELKAVYEKDDAEEPSEREEPSGAREAARSQRRPTITDVARTT